VRILGLDPGSRVCGYGVIESDHGQLRYVECGVLTAPDSRPMEQRLGEIAKGLREVIDELSPQVAAVEDVFTHQNVRSALALAQARGMALLVNLPFGGGGLLRSLRDRPLPDWAGEIGCTSWAQILLKFVLGHPAVTCVIPGTSRPEHMRDNARAGVGVMPDAALRKRMIASLKG